MFKILFTLVFGLVGVVFALALGVNARDNFRRLRRFTGTRLTPMDGLTGDTGKVAGTVMPQDDKPFVRAPFSGADCVAYHLLVEGLRPQVMEDDSGRRVITRVMAWDVVFERVVCEDLELADRTGRVAVDMSGAKELDLHHSDRTKTGDVTVGGATWRRMEEEFPEFERMPDGRYRATERRIQVGDTLLAAGTFERRGGRPRFVRHEPTDTESKPASSPRAGRTRDTRPVVRDGVLLTDQTDAEVTSRLRSHFRKSLFLVLGILAGCTLAPTIVWLVF